MGGDDVQQQQSAVGIGAPSIGEECDKESKAARAGENIADSAAMGASIMWNDRSEHTGSERNAFNDLIFEIRMKNKARKLANSTRSRMQKNLTAKQLRMIGDKSFGSRTRVDTYDQSLSKKPSLAAFHDETSSPSNPSERTSLYNRNNLLF